jgi:hypothetical protein
MEIDREDYKAIFPNDGALKNNYKDIGNKSG